MNTSPEINELAAALASAQGEMAHASKDRSNPAFKSKYADLASVVDACREPLSRHGIAVFQPPDVSMIDGGVIVRVETRFVHKSGQWASTEIVAWVADAKAQSIGSAITYLRRYGLSAMAGVAPDDDDGNGASQGTYRPPVQAAPEPRREEPRAQARAVTPAEAGEIVRGKHPHLAAEIAQLVARTDIADAAKLDELRKLRDGAKPADAALLAEARKLLIATGHASKEERARVDQLVGEYSRGSGRLEDIGPGDLGGFVAEVQAVINGRAAA